MTTEILSAAGSRERKSAIERAVELLRAGEAVALPSETVYGLAADALEADAVAKIFEAKDRPKFDPLIIHLPTRELLGKITQADEANELVDQLIERFWPGPLTLILPRRSVVPDLVTAGLETVAVRMSAHPVFTEIIREFGSPLAAPSANRFGRISPTTAEHVRAELDGRIPLIVDGGPTVHGLESTIVAVRCGRMEILRQGPVTSEQLAEFGEVTIVQAGPRPEAPGQLRSHYAPRTLLVLESKIESFVIPRGKRAGALRWKEIETGPFAEVRTLSAAGDLREAAANLFRYLRELDDATLDLIVAEAVPEEGLGRAIMDRLRHAAAPT